MKDEVDEIMDDWFDRDSSTYVRKRTTGRVGWETLTDGAYSKFFASGSDTVALFSRASSLARDTLLAMCPNRHLKVSVSKSDSFTRNDQVFVATDVLDDTRLSANERLDIFMGLVVHEGCHVRYTKPLSSLTVGASQIIKFLWNLIEDERIEILCGQDIPGFANFLEKTKYYYFDYARKRTPAKQSPLDTILNILLKVIRYPKYLERDTVRSYLPYMQRIKDVLHPYPMESGACEAAAKAIYDIIVDFVDEHNNPGNGGSDGKDSSDAPSDSQDEGKGGCSGDDSSQEEPTPTAGSESGCGEESSGDSDSDESSEGNEGNEEGSGSDSTSDGQSEQESEQDSAGTPSTTMASIEDEFFSKKDVYRAYRNPGNVASSIEKSVVLSKVFSGDAFVGEQKTLFIPTSEFKNRYMSSLTRVKPYVSAIRKSLECHFKEYKVCHHSMRSGFLDPMKIAEAVQGVPHVYMQNGEVRTEKMSVCLVIDESGSMCGSKIDSARDSAILLYEAMKGIRGIEMFVYGHSADDISDGYTEIHMYMDKTSNGGKYSLGSVTDRANNRDGVAIYEVAKRVRAQTRNPVLMFVLSDGSPNAVNYCGKPAQTHTIDMVKKVEAMDFHVIHVKIKCSDSFKMCKHSIEYNDVSNFPRDFSKEVKSVVKKMANVVVS